MINFDYLIQDLPFHHPLHRTKKLSGQDLQIAYKIYECRMMMEAQWKWVNLHLTEIAIEINLSVEIHLLLV